MKVYELASTAMVYGKPGMRCTVDVESDEIRSLFHIGGFSGLVNQLPAYLGGYEVKNLDITDNGDGIECTFSV